MRETLPEGLKVSCRINDKIITEGVIHHEGSRIFLCQNEMAGDSCEDKQGYRYSWSLERNDINCPGAGVSRIRY